MRPKTSRSRPHTINEVVDDPVDGMVPVDELVGLPPAEAPGFVVVAVIVNVAVRVPLFGPLEVTV